MAAISAPSASALLPVGVNNSCDPALHRPLRTSYLKDGPGIVTSDLLSSAARGFWGLLVCERVRGSQGRRDTTAELESMRAPRRA